MLDTSSPLIILSELYWHPTNFLCHVHRSGPQLTPTQIRLIPEAEQQLHVQTRAARGLWASQGLHRGNTVSAAVCPDPLLYLLSPHSLLCCSLSLETMIALHLHRLHSWVRASHRLIALLLLLLLFHLLRSRPPREIPQFLCPDRNKVNFIPKSGSAFCLVSIPKPLMPTQELNNLKNQSAARLTPEPEPRVSRRTCMLSQQPSGSSPSSCLSES